MFSHKNKTVNLKYFPSFLKNCIKKAIILPSANTVDLCQLVLFEFINFTSSNRQK